MTRLCDIFTPILEAKAARYSIGAEVTRLFDLLRVLSPDKDLPTCLDTQDPGENGRTASSRVDRRIQGVLSGMTPGHLLHMFRRQVQRRLPPAEAEQQLAMIDNTIRTFEDVVVADIPSTEHDLNTSGNRERICH